MGDKDDDTHLCLRCRSTITGLQQYIIHRKRQCSAGKQVEQESETIPRSAVHHYEPSPLRADDFFSSLELQSIQVSVPGSTAASKPVQADDDFDEAEDSDNDLYPPRTHTGGKWKPGSRPENSLWKNLQSPNKRFQDGPDKSEDSDCYCILCDRRYRDKYSFLRHTATSYHIKRSGGRQMPCKRSSRKKSSKLSNIIHGLLAKDTQKGIIEKPKLRKATRPSQSYSTRPEVHQTTDEFSVHSCKQENLSLYIHCVDPREVMGRTHSPSGNGRRKNPRQALSNSVMSEHVKGKRNQGGEKDNFSQHDTGRIETGMHDSSRDAAKAPAKGTKLKAGTSKLSCPYCSKVLNKVYMKFHIFTHTGERPFQCHLCGRTFVHRSTLSTHIKHHLGLKQYRCNQCLFRAVRPSMLRRHQKSIHGSDICKRTMYCHTCGLAHYNHQSLRQHMLQHAVDSHQGATFEGRNTFLCDTCGLTTATMHQLTTHKRKHTGCRPFKCGLCEFSSSRSGPLQRHLRVHTGVKPYKCPHCDYACSSQENLRKHVLGTKKHVGKKMYVCAKCAFGSNEFSKFKHHIKNEHGGQRAQPMDEATLTGEINLKNEVEETLSDMQQNIDLDKTVETVMKASIATSQVPLSQAEPFDLMSRESCSLEITAQSDIPDLGEVDGFSPLRSPMHQVSSTRKEATSAGHDEHGTQVTSSAQKSYLKTPYLLESSKNHPVFYVSSSDFSGLGSALETATLDSFLPVRSPLSKTAFGPNIAGPSVENSVVVEPVDPASCVLLSELHEQLGAQVSDTVGVTQLDGNNAVYICMPLNGP